MNKGEFEKKLVKYLKEINIVLNEKQISQFYAYMNLLLEWNEKINLTAITDPEEIILKHFVDSLTIVKYIENSKTIVDIGTGAGFPGIPIKIYKEDIDITFVDSLNKRINFLNEIIEKLELKRIKAIHSRAEEFGKNKKYRESFDIATSRAVANMSTLSEYLIPLVKKKGRIICMKGSDVDSELEKAKAAIEILGGKVERIDSFTLPQSDIRRNIICIEKIDGTPIKYPRKPGTPAKEPL